MSNSYHDVIVHCGDTIHRIIDDAAYKLVCTKAAGWELWHVWDGKERLLGYEFDKQPFKIVAGNVVVCENLGD